MSSKNQKVLPMEFLLNPLKVNRQGEEMTLRSRTIIIITVLA